MMKFFSKCGLILLTFLIFFSLVTDVRADVNSDHYHVYHVRSMNVNTISGQLEVKGFAYINHMDNYGGVNLKTSIVATGNGRSVEFPVRYVDSGYDYYYAVCQEDDTHKYCSKAHADEIKTSNLRRNNCNTNTYSDCATFNVNFEVNISLNRLKEELGTTGDIDFRIVTTNDIDNTTLSSEFGVYKGICTVNNIPGTCNSTIDLGNGSFIAIKDISDKVKVVVTDGRIRFANNGDVAINGRYYATGYDFQVARNSGYGSRSFCKNGSCFTINTFTILGNNTGSGTVYPSGTSGGTPFIIYDSWVRATGSMKLSFNPGENTVIPDVGCDPGYNDSSSKTAVCGSDSQGFKSCARQDVSVGVEYLISESAIAHPVNGTLCGGTRLTATISDAILIHESGNFTYGGIYTDPILAGRGFDFPSISYQNSIYWRYASSNISQKTVTFRYGKWNREKVSDGYYDKSVTERTYAKFLPGTSCEKLGSSIQNYNTNSESVAGCATHWSGVGATLTMNVHPWVDEDWDWKCYPQGNSVTVSYSYYMNQLNQAASAVAYKSISESNIQGSRVVSYDSNKVSSTEKDVSGSWVNTSESGNLNAPYSWYNNNYNFYMNDAYVKLIGNNASDVIYYNPSDNNYYNVGKKYFIPLLYPNARQFILNISRNNISIVNGIVWNLNGLCDVYPVNAMFDCKEGDCKNKFRYRSIDLGNPFPKGVIPVNWASWYSSDTNKRRIANTYDKGFVYSVNLINGNTANGKLGTNVIDAIDTNYNSWAGMNKDGISSFVTTDVTGAYFNKKNENSYCKIGKFDASCDK